MREAGLVVACAAAGRECPKLLFTVLPQPGFPVVVNPDIGHVPVVEAGAAQSGIVENEAHWADQVKARPGVRTKPDNVARIGGDFGLVKDNVEHGGSAFVF